MPITSGERVSATRVENIIDHQRGRSQGRHWCRGFPSILCKRRRCSGPIGAFTRIFDALWACAAGDMRVCPACRGTPDIHTLVEPIERRAAHAGYASVLKPAGTRQFSVRWVRQRCASGGLLTAGAHVAQSAVMPCAIENIFSGHNTFSYANHVRAVAQFAGDSPARPVEQHHG